MAVCSSVQRALRRSDQVDVVIVGYSTVVVILRDIFLLISLFDFLFSVLSLIPVVEF